MGLLAEQKQQRRDRIRAEARTLMSEVGYDGLTVRALADACGLSVPTLYNLVGSKAEIVAADAIATFAQVASRFGERRSGDVVAQTVALFDIVYDEVTGSASYYQALLPHLDAVPELRRVRDQIAQLQVSHLMVVLQAAPKSFAPAFDLRVAVVALFDLAVAQFTGWAVGRVSLQELRPRLMHGLALMLGVGARGVARKRLSAVAASASKMLTVRTTEETAVPSRTR